MSLTAVERAIIESSYWAIHRNQELQTLATGLELEGAKILNVGSGRPDLTHELLANFRRQIVNIDIEYFDGLDAVASATNLPFADGTFDVVIFLRVLHHINDFRKALSEAVRCTKPGGFVLISEPYDLVVKLTRATGLDSHPPNIITQKDIEEFVRDNQLSMRQKWAWIFWYYYGYQIYKSKK